jgi:hypothetical protein
MPIIKDPKMNPGKEYNFGIVYDDTEGAEAYYLYYKGNLDLQNNRRYFIAGTVVDILHNSQMPLNKKPFKYEDGFLTTNIYEWVKISQDPHSDTGQAVMSIFNKIKNTDLNFPSAPGKNLEHYTDNITPYPQ